MENQPAPTQESNYQKLGIKTFWLFVIDRIQIAVIFLFVAIALFILSAQNFFTKLPQIGNGQAYATLGGWIAFGIAVIAFILAFLVSWLVYINYRYALEDEALKIKRGVFEKEEIAIPYRQIQDIDIERDLTYQMLGMSRLVILTAGHEDEPHPEGESEGILPALDRSLAEELQATLLKKTDVQKVTEVKE